MVLRLPIDDGFSMGLTILLGFPLITLLFLDFIGTAMFLYAAADLTGLVDPEKPDNFQGCYAAFMADAVGTL